MLVCVATVALGTLLGSDFSHGFVGIAVQQGGIGILLTVLLISTPPIAASFFQGTLGNFAHYTAWQGAGNVGQRPGEPGYRGQQPPNTATGGGNEGGWRTSQQPPSSAPATTYNNPATSGNYGTSPVHTDTVKTAPNRRTE